jgi:hypothetical protein
MPATYENIATTTLSSAATSITFNSIPGTYTDLRFTLLVTSTSGNSEGVRLNYNNNSSAIYGQNYESGTGSVATAGSANSDGFIILHYDGTSTSIPTFYYGDIFNYAGSQYKTAVTGSAENKNGSGNTTFNVANFRSTTAITSLKLSTASAVTFSVGTTATLYGIKNA